MKETIIITGAAGTLGKAFVRLLHDRYDIIAIDNSEWAISALRLEFPGIQTVLKDFSDFKFTDYLGDTLIHCAAFKHVDLGESDPISFIENNVTKTAKLFEMAHWYGVDILFISTDKAVEPISTYGFTKALGEKLCTHFEGTVARLGNIIGSTGSVIPVWEEAIANKAPIKITDERMVRYLIEDMDAVQDIWQQYQAGKKLIVPEMEAPKRIMDIVTEVLKRHGYDKPEDYPGGIEVIGMRPGEKLEEKLKWDHE